MLATPVSRPARSRAAYRRPDIVEYESRKQINVAAFQPAPRDFRPDVHNMETFFAHRIEAIATGEEPVSVYPGRHIPAPGVRNRHVDRGSSFARQHAFARRHYTGWSSPSYSTTPVAPPDIWLWRHIELPKICQLVEQYTDTCDLVADRKVVVPHLARAAQTLSLKDLHQCLDEVRALWDADPVASATIESLSMPLLNLLKLVPRFASDTTVREIAFELDAFVSFEQNQRSTDAIFCHWFGGNFVSVISQQLENVLLTERCQTERLLEELLNLPDTKFAPVLINEYGNVSDGNHRVTAAWIWNALKFCEHESWDLDNESFQRRIALFSTRSQISTPQLHEMLYHLSCFLTTAESRALLHTRIAPAVAKNNAISTIPVVLLPEYLSGAVQKAHYDSGEAVIRCHHETYKYLRDHRAAVLQPRASYHFTDAVLLPWFSVLTNVQRSWRIQQ